MYEDTDLWPFKCPNCFHEFTKQIGRVKAGDRVICPDCSTWLTDHDKEFAVYLAQARDGKLNPWGNMIGLKKP